MRQDQLVLQVPLRAQLVNRDPRAPRDLPEVKEHQVRRDRLEPQVQTASPDQLEQQVRKVTKVLPDRLEEMV